MRLYDLSPQLDEKTAVWPGDEHFRRRINLQMSHGAPVNLSSISLSLHAGSHADAPSHFDDGAPTIDQANLAAYLGPARVVRIEAEETLKPSDFAPILRSPPRRLLVSCNPIFRRDRFPKSFVHFTPESAQALGRAGICLIGLDAPSVDHVDSKDLPCHHMFHHYGVAILENLMLNEVPEGDYELIALPLRIVQGDASPVRAVLRPL